MSAATEFLKSAAPGPSPWLDQPLLDGPLAAQIKSARAELLDAANAAASTGHPGHAERVSEVVQELGQLLTQYEAHAADLAGLEDIYRQRQADLEATALHPVTEVPELQTNARKAYVQLLAAELARNRRAEELAAEDGSAASWEPADLTPWLSGEAAEVAPTVLEREDGACLFYAGSNLLFGDSGSGKSLVMCATVAQQIQTGRVCVWLDYEEATPATTVSRLLALGVSTEQLAECLVWLHPASAATQAMLSQVVSTAVERAGDRVVGLVVVDSVGEALAVEGLNEDRDSEVAPWLNRLKTLTDQLPDAALVLIDHSTKAKDGAGRLFPSGSKRKRASLTGAAWLAETVEEFAKGKPGSVQLVCAKDRHGTFRRGEPGALVTVAPGEAPGALTVRVRPPVVGLVPSESLWPLVVQAVQACKKSGEPLSKNQMTDAMTGAGNQRKRAAVDLAVELGAITRTKAGQSTLHAFVRELTHADAEAVAAVCS